MAKREERILSTEDVDLEALIKDREFTPSPEAWEDQTLYFLLLDRFSNGQEKGYRSNANRVIQRGTTPLFTEADRGNAFQNGKDGSEWITAGDHWCGGNLKGLTEKIGYLKRLGVTAVWVSPVLKQCAFAEYDYHGYGTQNFYEIDPHFGTREELRELVDTAHKHGIYVILDIILNHTGDVFAYDTMDPTPWNGQEYPARGFRNAKAEPAYPLKDIDLDTYKDVYPDGAVWPRELQNIDLFTRKGYMVNWDNFPEYEEGDFFSLKDVHLGHCENDQFVPSEALKTLCKVYKYWIAYADLDGFRIDTVKHMGTGAVSFFAHEIEEFTQRIGKSDFYLIGEITGGRANAHQILEETFLDAALGIDEIPQKIRDVVCGRTNPAHYFSMFVNTRHEERATSDPNWWRSKVVTFFDDHDQVGRGVKQRFAAEFGEDIALREKALLRAVAFQTTTLGVPCLYYGSEQGFDGHAQSEEGGVRYIRESMFGGAFGAFRTQDRHFFDEGSPLYQEMARILALRAEHTSLRRGRQYLRQVSSDGKSFWTPEVIGDPYRGIIAWSRIMDSEELLCAMNTDSENPCSLWVTVDDERHAPGSKPLKCLYSTDPEQVGCETSGPPEARNGSAVCITVPAGGFVIFE